MNAPASGLTLPTCTFENTNNSNDDTTNSDKISTDGFVRRSTRKHQPTKRLTNDDVYLCPQINKKIAAVAAAAKHVVAASSADDSDEEPLSLKKHRMENREDRGENREETKSDKSKKKKKRRKGSSSTRHTTKEKTKKKISSSSSSKHKIKIKNEKKRKIKQQKYGTEQQRTCPRCQKVFLEMHGLAYHLKHEVCKRDEHFNIKDNKSSKDYKETELESSAVSNKKKSSSTINPTTVNLTSTELIPASATSHPSKPSAGSQTQRTSFPRGFTSVGSIPFPPIKSGAKFITEYGIVRVVSDPIQSDYNDSRAITVEDRMEAKCVYRKLERMSEKLNEKRNELRSVEHIERRKVLKDLYWKKGCWNVNVPPIISEHSNGVAAAAHKERVTREGVSYELLPPSRLPPSDPLAPNDSYPDRIVECILVNDTRTRIYGSQLESDNNSDNTSNRTTTQESTTTKAATVVKLYLRRRILQKIYNPSLSIYVCEYCGKQYHSKMGYTQHLDGNVCRKIKVQKDNICMGSREKKEKKLPEYDYYANASRKKKDSAAVVVAERKSPSSKNKHKQQQQPSNVQYKDDDEDETMGYNDGGDDDDDENYHPTAQNVSEDSHDDDDDDSNKHQVTNKKKFKKAPTASRSTTGKKPAAESLSPVEISKLDPTDIPDNVAYKNFKGYRGETRVKNRCNEEGRTKSGKVKKGTLGYASSKGKKRGERKRRMNHLRNEFVPPPLPTPPVIVDLTVLVEEIDTGRYPSMRRYFGEHADYCHICKRGGELFCCEFCSNTNHIFCLKEKVAIKDPGPDDDFMCSSCALKVLSRRSRAEKRRLMKMAIALKDAGVDDVKGQATVEGKMKTPLQVNDPTKADIPQLASKKAETTAAASLRIKNIGEDSSDDHDDNDIDSNNSNTATTASKHLISYPNRTRRHNPVLEFAMNSPEALHGHKPTYKPCRNGGPGGLICCETCSAAYSRYLSDTSKEMEIQTISKCGRDMNELLELLQDAQLRLRQGLREKEVNNIRRNLTMKNG